MTKQLNASGMGPVQYAPALPATGHDRQRAEAAVSGIRGVRGFGEGVDAIGQPAWIVYVTDASVKRLLPVSVGGRSIVIHVTGEIDAQ